MVDTAFPAAMITEQRGFGILNPCSFLRSHTLLGLLWPLRARRAVPLYAAETKKEWTPRSRPDNSYYRKASARRFRAECRFHQGRSLDPLVRVADVKLDSFRMADKSEVTQRTGFK